MNKLTLRKILIGIATFNLAALVARRMTQRRGSKRKSINPPAEPSVPLDQPRPIEQPGPIEPASTQPALVTQHAPLDRRLFILAIIVFALTRFIGLTRFPIYFFTDEAIQTVQAADFLQHNFQDANGESFPTYFQNGTYYNLSFSVYVQAIPYLLFGYTDFVTRAVSALIALSGTAAIGLILRDGIKLRWWWIGTLILSITPAWFLHSRTAFETAEATAFYAWFIYFYLRYRQGRTRFLLAALLFGALTFYSYSPAQLVVVATGALMLLSDVRYHWQTLRRHWRLLIISAVLLVGMALPYIRFQNEHPAESFYHLRILNSYLTDNSLTPADKLDRFWQEYTFGLSPAYWYSTNNTRDLIRHQMKGYGNLWWPTLPFALIGLAVCLAKFRSSPHRSVLIALLAAPIGGALVQVQVYRALIIVIPAALLTSIGLITCLSVLNKRLNARSIAIGSFIVLGAINGYMLYDALTNGPIWYDDYGLGGLQYGAQQIFSEAEQIVQSDPNTIVQITPTWANGTDVLLQFFAGDNPNIRLANIDAYILHKMDLNDQLLFVMTPEEYQRAAADPRFTHIRLQATLKYPNGTDGFYFVRLNYSPQADAIFAAEDTARRQPVQEDITLDGQTVHVLHSRFDSGRLADLFDGDTFTLARTAVDNPAFLEFTFDQPRSMRGITLTTGTLDFVLTVTVHSDEVSAGQVYSQTFTGLPPDPTVSINFGSTIAVKKLRIEIKDIRAATDNHIHIREIQFGHGQ